MDSLNYLIELEKKNTSIKYIGRFQSLMEYISNLREIELLRTPNKEFCNLKYGDKNVIHIFSLN